MIEEHITDKPIIPPELEPLAEEMRKYKTWKEFEKISIVDKDFRPHPEWLVFIDTLEKIPTKELLGRDIGREILTSEKLNEILKPTGKYRFANLKSFWEAACVKEVWRMTREEFLANPPEEVDIWLVEGKPPHRGKIGSTPDFFGGPPTRGYRVANTVTPFDIAHKNIVKHALEEGKPVPQEVLRDYPDLTKKVNSNHIIWESEHIT